jgi:hypothetical protein
VTYRINYSFRAADEGGRAAWPLVDASIPVPYNLGQGDFWHRCRRIPGAVGHPNYECERVETQALTWEYPEVLPDGRRSVEAGIDFNIYARDSDSAVPRLVGTAVQSWSFGLPEADCGQRTYYSASAILGSDPVTHEQLQSPLSEEFSVPPSCAALEITLQPLWVYGVNDGDFCTIFTDCRDDYEAYGWMMFNRRRVAWNSHCDPGFGEGCVRATPSYNTLLEASEHDWADMWLNHGSGWRQGNNVFRIPIHDGEPIRLVFQFWDHDGGSADDMWCGMPSGRSQVMAPARSAAEWLAFDQELVYDYNCILRFRARGVPGS